jgi:hypothetical protein
MKSKQQGLCPEIHRHYLIESRFDGEMLPVASWFHSADRSLMRFYGGHTEGPFFCSAGDAGENVSISEDHARRRARKLTEAGLLEKSGVSYRTTELGMRYVRGEVDQDELEALNPDADDSK